MIRYNCVVINVNFKGIRETSLTAGNVLLVYVDVTGPARELERSHLCGPAAGLVQAEALACVSLLGSEISRNNETVTLRFRVSGPIAGILVENAAGGGLRGYTHKKVLNDLDTMQSVNDIKTLGEFGELSVVRSIPGKTLSSSMINVRPAYLASGLRGYYTEALQRTVELELVAHSTVDGVEYARVLLIECMPDGDKRSYNKLCRKIAGGVVAGRLQKPCGIKELCELLEIGDYDIKKTEPLMFKCRCSAERVERMVNALPDEDIKEMIHGEKSTRIVCHMCGETYKINKEALWSILEKRGHDMDLGVDFNCD
ncbi:MAG: Hsp33 family molecular chaperone HslO [Kiritimatiellia bacterium]